MSRPRVTLKLATSLDGKIATSAGESRWITGAEARVEVHRMRVAHDAVLVGIGTVLADDPELTARMEPAPPRQPLRVVLDRQWRFPRESRLARTAGMGEVIVVGVSAPFEEPPEGVSYAFGSALPGEGETEAALRTLATGRQIDTLMVEGGGVVAASFIREGLVDRLEWFRAPIVIGAEGRPGIGQLALGALAQAPRFRRVAVRPLGQDLWESYERV